MEGLFDYTLWGLFLASFLAATVVPFSSEALLVFLIIKFLRYVIWRWLTGLVF